MLVIKTEHFGAHTTFESSAWIRTNWLGFSLTSLGRGGFCPTWIMTTLCSHPKCSFDRRPSYRDVADTLNGLHRRESIRSRTSPTFTSPEVEILMCRERDKENRRNSCRKNSNNEQQSTAPIPPPRKFRPKDQKVNIDKKSLAGASKKGSSKATIKVGPKYQSHWYSIYCKWARKWSNLLKANIGARRYVASYTIS